MYQLLLLEHFPSIFTLRSRLFIPAALLDWLLNLVGKIIIGAYKKQVLLHTPVYLHTSIHLCKPHSLVQKAFIDRISSMKRERRETLLFSLSVGESSP